MVRNVPFVKVRGAVSLVFFVAVLMPVAALADDDHPPPARTLSPEEALSIDAQTIAVDQGWDEEATLARLKRQEARSAFVTGLAAEYRDTFGGAWTGDGPEGQLFVRFVGRVPAESQHQAEQQGITAVFVGGATHSLAEWQARAEQVHADLLAHGHPEVVTTFSVREELILATATRPPDDTRSDAELRARLSAASRAPDVALTFAAGPIAGDTHTTPSVLQADTDQARTVLPLLASGSLTLILLALVVFLRHRRTHI